MRQAVDFVDEQQVPFLEIGQEGSQVARPLDGRARRDAQVDPQFVGDDAGHSRLAQARRPVQEDVVQCFFAQFRRLDEDFQIIFDLILANIFP